MKPAAFSYESPQTLRDALQILAEHGEHAKILAGGQSLIPAMNFRVTAPSLLVDLNRIGELSYIRREPEGPLHIGAMTRQRDVEQSEVIQRDCPLLFETMPQIAHPQIRNRGTIGGSLVHADPAAELPVVMVALDARFTLASAGGTRVVTARDFFKGMFTVDARPDEILSEISIPAARPNMGSAFLEVARRQGDYAMMGIAAIVELATTGDCVSVELVYLNAGDKPVRAPSAAAALLGGPHSPVRVATAAETASRAVIEPVGNLHASAEYQRHLAQVLTRRALDLAFARGSKRQPITGS